MTKSPETEYYQSLDGDWRWRVRTPNGNIVADSSEGYKNRLDCVAGYHAAQEAP
jgi:uncharacterized protein YegP (UPF0339 family)